jgi:hypothetical protein
MSAGAAGRPADYVVGEVMVVDQQARRLSLRTDSGETVPVVVPEGTPVLRARPGAKDLAGATPSSLAEIAAGDRVMVRGALSDDGAARQARQLVVMTRNDLARKREAERGEWRRRGILGRVTAVDAARGEITVRMGRWGDSLTLVLPTAGRAVVFRRYPPDSVQFSDARPSTLADLKVGDELRALGDRGEDGRTFLAEQIVSGSFVNVTGTLVAVDLERSDLTLRDEETRKTLEVTVGPDARLRRLPPQVAARLAGRAEATGPSEGAERPPRMEEPGRMGGPGPEELLDRLPPLALAELKVGDRVLVSSTRGTDPTRLNAIALVAGLEALAPPSGRGRGGRGADVGLAPELLDLGMGPP